MDEIRVMLMINKIELMSRKGDSLGICLKSELMTLLLNWYYKSISLGKIKIIYKKNSSLEDLTELNLIRISDFFVTYLKIYRI
jgi:hypothetical protein